MKISPPLVVGIILPILLIIGLFITIILPSLLLKPHYDFIYSDENTYDSASAFEIKQGQLVRIQSATSTATVASTNSPNLYRYNVQTNAVHQISDAEAKHLILDPGPTSPDGFRVSRSQDSGGPFSYGSDGNTYYLMKGSTGKTLPGISGDYQGYEQFRFIAWIVNN